MAQQSPRLVATVIWAALLTGASAFLGVALYLVFGLGGGAGLGASPGIRPVLIGASAVLSLVTVAASWLWAARMRLPARPATPRPGAPPPGPETDGLSRLVVSCALAEGGALFAVIAFLLTGSALALAPCALSWLALAAHFPGERHWAQLTGVPAGAARRGTR